MASGRLSDRLVTNWKRKRGGKWHPEDRLRATFSGGLIFVPLSVLGCGLVTQHIEGYLGLILNLILIFFNGVGVHFNNLSPHVIKLNDLFRSPFP
jgi:hypothetical protein